MFTELAELISLWEGNTGWEVLVMANTMEKEANKRKTQENLTDWTTLRVEEFKLNQTGCGV